MCRVPNKHKCFSGEVLKAKDTLPSSAPRKLAKYVPTNSIENQLKRLNSGTAFTQPILILATGSTVRARQKNRIGFSRQDRSSYRMDLELKMTPRLFAKPQV